MSDEQYLISGADIVQRIISQEDFDVDNSDDYFFTHPLEFVEYTNLISFQNRFLESTDRPITRSITALYRYLGIWEESQSFYDFLYAEASRLGYLNVLPVIADALTPALPTIAIMAALSVVNSKAGT